MSLFLQSPVLHLTTDELDILTRPIAPGHEGGWQSFLKAVIASLGPDGVLMLDDGELQRVYRYAYGSGSGGYQDRFRVIIKAAFRAGWVQP